MHAGRKCRSQQSGHKGDKTIVIFGDEQIRRTPIDGKYEPITARISERIRSDLLISTGNSRGRGKQNEPEIYLQRGLQKG
jgi:hypothetical protein